MEKDKCKDSELPLTDAEREAVETLKARGGVGRCVPLDDDVQVIIDHNFVSVPITRYDELIRAEAELDVVLRAYQSLAGYHLEDVLQAIFGPKPEADHA